VLLWLAGRILILTPYPIAAAFGLYAMRYWPVLSRPRLDGKPG